MKRNKKIYKVEKQIFGSIILLGSIFMRIFTSFASGEWGIFPIDLILLWVFTITIFKTKPKRDWKILFSSYLFTWVLCFTYLTICFSLNDHIFASCFVFCHFVGIAGFNYYNFGGYSNATR